ncbi:uncharacterized protein F5Z01DRAFT_636561 [Emericellopsis atlantica]|uniref:Uncharacterized protein n=1 Tax=Emericellopsis atlantica TaxID=2614577 RepID=A0A9P7ZM60_9HYPO|nr:uncharacterized protein F5Z01DRAFT_636561 [Emericellopsis atlantica]KAG9254486.1 hypothetical protein F5Z01DRAFT_636561 [Emericellopsis atlantica]
MAPKPSDIGRDRPGSCTRSDRFAWSDEDREGLQALFDGSDILKFGHHECENNAVAMRSTTDDHAEHDRALMDPSPGPSKRTLGAKRLMQPTADAVFDKTKVQGTSKLPGVPSNPKEGKMCLVVGDIGGSDASKERQQRHHRNHAHGATGDSVESTRIQRWLHEKGQHASDYKQAQSFIPQLKSRLYRNPAQGGSPSAADSADSRSASPQSSISSPLWQPSVPVACRHNHRPSTPSDRQHHSPSTVGRPQLARQSHLFEISLKDSSSADSTLSDEEDWDLVENPMNDSVHSDKAGPDQQRKPLTCASWRPLGPQPETPLDPPFYDAVHVSESPEREYDEMVASEETQAIRSDWTVPDSAGRSQLLQETYAFEAKYPNAAPVLRGLLSQTHLFETVGFVRPTINPAWDQFASALDKAVRAGEVAGEGMCIAVEGAKIVGKVANDIVFTLAPNLWD